MSMLKLLQLSFRRQVWRSVCSAAAGEAATRGAAAAARRVGVRSCTVDPNLAEQFVFLDCAGEQLQNLLLCYWFRYLSWLLF